MSKEKHKRDYLPTLRKLCKELEDAIIERNEEAERKCSLELEIALRKIRKSKFLED